MASLETARFMRLRQGDKIVAGGGTDRETVMVFAEFINDEKGFTIHDVGKHGGDGDC